MLKLSDFLLILFLNLNAQLSDEVNCIISQFLMNRVKVNNRRMQKDETSISKAQA